MEYEKNFLLSQKNTLFSDIAEEDLRKLYKCLCAKEKAFKREFFVFHQGDNVKFVYLVLSGNLHVINEDFWGNRSITETLNTDTLFGEAYIFSEKNILWASLPLRI